MRNMFYNCNSFKSLDISLFNTKNVLNMDSMFYNCTSLTSLDISNFNIQTKTYISNMFHYCHSLIYINISNLVTDKNITIFSELPDYCEIMSNKEIIGKINHSLPKTSQIFIDDERCLRIYNSSLNGECLTCKDGFELYMGECIAYSFYASYFISDENNINIFNYNKTNIFYVMKINDTFMEPNQDIYVTEIENNTNYLTVYYYLNEKFPLSLSNLFENNTNLLYFSFNNRFAGNSIIMDMNKMFSGCISLTNASIYISNAKNLIDISYLFSGCISLINVNILLLNSNELNYMNNLFYNCFHIIDINIENINTYKVFNMSEMFYNCSSLKSINISQFNTENVIDMSKMFYNCNSLSSLDVSQFNTKNVTNMSSMFYNCSSLTSMDISNFNIKI